MRAAAQMVSYEIGMGFVLVTVLMVAGTLNLTQIVVSQNTGSLPTWDSIFCHGTGCRCCRCS